MYFELSDEQMLLRKLNEKQDNLRYGFYMSDTPKDTCLMNEMPKNLKELEEWKYKKLGTKIRNGFSKTQEVFDEWVKEKRDVQSLMLLDLSDPKQLLIKKKLGDKNHPLYPKKLLKQAKSSTKQIKKNIKRFNIYALPCFQKIPPFFGNRPSRYKKYQIPAEESPDRLLGRLLMIFWGEGIIDPPTPTLIGEVYVYNFSFN